MRAKGPFYAQGRTKEVAAKAACARAASRGNSPARFAGFKCAVHL